MGAGLIPLRGGYRGLRAFDYSAITDCSMLTAYQRTQAPQCGGSGAATTPVAVYQAPAQQTPSNCIDPASGMPYFSPDCVEANLRIEAANQAARDAANRSVFVQNCQNAWELNRAQYEALGMPVPPNDCAYRGYGQTLPGTTGGTTAYLPGTPQTVVDWRTANPGGGVLNAWDAGSAETLREFNAPTAPLVTPTPPASASGGAAPSGVTTVQPAGHATPVTGSGQQTANTTTAVDYSAWLKKPAVILGGVALIGFLIWKANQ